MMERPTDLYQILDFKSVARALCLSQELIASNFSKLIRSESSDQS